MIAPFAGTISLQRHRGHAGHSHPEAGLGLVASECIYQLAGCCCVMQWMLPALRTTSRDITPTT